MCNQWNANNVMKSDIGKLNGILVNNKISEKKMFKKVWSDVEKV